mgnify:CR=1 FL=1
MSEKQKADSLIDKTKEQILELIGRMNLSFSTRMLSEKQLADKFGVSRTTARAALTKLEIEGKVIRKHGSGTYVNLPALNMKATLYPGVNMFDIIERNGFKSKVTVESVTFQEAGEYAEKMNLRPSDRIQTLESIYYADEKPCMYCLDRFNARFFTGIDWNQYQIKNGSIYEFIHDSSGILITWDMIRVVAADSDESPALRLLFHVPDGANKPLVRLEMMNFDTNNQPVWLGNIYVDTDIINLNMIRELNEI